MPDLSYDPEAWAKGIQAGRILEGPMTAATPPPSDAVERWLAQQRAERVQLLGATLADQFEAVAMESAAGMTGRVSAVMADKILACMADAYRIGRGRRDPVAQLRLESIVKAWHREVCGCMSDGCTKRAAIVLFVEG